MGFSDSTVHFREWPMVGQREKAVALTVLLYYYDQSFTILEKNYSEMAE